MARREPRLRAHARSAEIPGPAEHGRWPTDELRYQLTEAVNGYIGRCDEDAARAGIEWMRERYRERGQTPTF